MLSEFKVLTQVDLSHLFVISQFTGCPGFQYCTLEHQIGTVSYGKGFVYIMVGYKDADILLLEF